MLYPQHMTYQGIFHIYNLHHQYNLKQMFLNFIHAPVLMDGLFPSMLFAYIAVSLKT